MPVAAHVGATAKVVRGLSLCTTPGFKLSRISAPVGGGASLPFPYARRIHESPCGVGARPKYWQSLGACRRGLGRAKSRQGSWAAAREGRGRLPKSWAVPAGGLGPTTRQPARTSGRLPNTCPRRLPEIPALPARISWGVKLRLKITLQESPPASN